MMCSNSITVLLLFGSDYIFQHCCTHILLVGSLDPYDSEMLTIHQSM